MDQTLWVRFVNTQYLDGDIPADSIATASDLVAWAVRRELIDEKNAQEMLSERGARQVHERALQLRGQLRSLASSLCTAGVVGPEIHHALNETLNASTLQALFAGDGAETKELLAIEGPGPQPILTLVSLSAGRFLTSGPADRLKQCDSSDCILYFLDSSRNKSRRWCSMETCGNREKVRAHYKRRVAQTGP